MADISFNDTQVKQQVNQVNPVQNAPQVHEISADINKTPVSAPAEKSSFENESLENVVATSEHGDTVQVFDEGEEKSSTIPQFGNPGNDYTIAGTFPEEDKAIGTSRDEEGEDIQITSLAGYTEAQLEQLYRDGEITKQEYEREIAEDEALTEEADEDREELSYETVLAEDALVEGRRIRNAMDNIQSPDSSDTISAATRSEIVRNTEGIGEFAEDEALDNARAAGIPTTAFTPYDTDDTADKIATNYQSRDVSNVTLS